LGSWRGSEVICADLGILYRKKVGDYFFMVMEKWVKKLR